MMYLARNLKLLREMSGEKRGDIARLLGVTEMTVARYESGESEPGLEKIILLADHFVVSLDRLITQEIEDNKLILMKNVRYLRKKFDLTWQDIANLLHIPGTEEGTCIPRATSGEGLNNLANYFGLTVEQMTTQDLSEQDV